MIVMTSGILFSIDPWLALATLLPFPLIVWLVIWRGPGCSVAITWGVSPGPT